MGSIVNPVEISMTNVDTWSMTNVDRLSMTNVDLWSMTIVNMVNDKRRCHQAELHVPIENCQ